MKSLFPFWTIVLIASICQTLAQTPHVVVTKGRLQVHVMSIGGDNGTAATRLIEKNLLQSGMIDPSGPENAQYTVGGNLTAGGVTGSLTDKKDGSQSFSKIYSGSWRRAVNEFSDDLVKTLTGVPGIATTRIAFIVKTGGAKELYVMDIDGSSAKKITSDRVLCGSPAFSPDGSRIAYTSYKSGYPDIYVVDVASGQRNRVAAFPGLNSGATFSPSGGKLAMTLSKDGSPDIYVMSTGGGGASRLTRTLGTEASPSWSPDGNQIVYSSDDRGSPQIYIIGASGGSPQRLSTGILYCTEPSWSPDGKKIAFNARVGGAFQVCIYDLTTKQTRQVTSSGNNEDPSWTRNSRHLVVSRSGSLVLLDSVTGKSYELENGLGNCTEPSCSR